MNEPGALAAEPSTLIAMSEPNVKRLNWGCGRSCPPGWINSDRSDYSHVDLPCDILEGLPLDTDSIDYAASSHALQEIAWDELVRVLGELRRVLKPGGVLRLCLPDLDKGIAAYLRKDKDHFLVPDEDARSLGGKMIVHMLWYGHSRMLFTLDFVEELLLKAGFSTVVPSEFGKTNSAFPGIVELDDREHESLFIEAFK
jgi:predicted SAM-dependent methyltransferase